MSHSANKIRCRRCKRALIITESLLKLAKKFIDNGVKFNEFQKADLGFQLAIGLLKIDKKIVTGRSNNNRKKVL